MVLVYGGLGLKFFIFSAKLFVDVKSDAFFLSLIDLLPDFIVFIAIFSLKLF
jgi:hypothetical protein